MQCAMMACSAYCEPGGHCPSSQVLPLKCSLQLQVPLPFKKASCSGEISLSRAARRFTATSSSQTPRPVQVPLERRPGQGLHTKPG